MSAPRPNGGATSSKPKNPGPQPVGPDKIYPPPGEIRAKAGGDTEGFYRRATVTAPTLATKPLMFQITTGRGRELEWPTSTGGHELDIRKDDTRDNDHLAMGARYRLWFERPVGSPETTPYVLDMVTATS